jgi:hypothetical protein
LSKRKDARHDPAYSPILQKWEIAMRILERLRVKLGFPPAELPNGSKKALDETDTAASASYVARAPESMCCGHCSGSAESRIPELPNAR